MKKTYARSLRLLIGLGLFFLFNTASQAGSPLWTFTPLTATTISLPSNATATVQYLVTNQSIKSHTLVMTPIKGITQITAGAGICGNPFTLPAKGSSCSLSLQIHGSQVISGTTNGPIVCQQGSSFQCYKPSASDILNVTVTPSQYTVGGAVAGLTDTVVLLNNGTDANPISNDGDFTFPTPLASGSNYNVTVDTQPTGQTCLLNNNSGTIGNSNVTNVSVTCTSNSTTLSASVSALALATNGNARIISITNTGIASAENVSYSISPALPSGTTINPASCGTIAASGTCILTITPGATASNTPSVLTLQGSNTNTLTSDVDVLTYGSIYQEGYIFDIDDTTPNTTSIGGTTASLTNNSSATTWLNGAFSVTNAQSLTDGASNTATIIAVQGAGNDAASLCNDYTIDSAGNSPCTTGTCYSGWYLPAICQMGDAGQSASCAPGTPNMVTNLSSLISGCVGASCLSGTYWSSTEFSGFPSLSAWVEIFSSDTQAISNKANTFDVRCTRAITS